MRTGSNSSFQRDLVGGVNVKRGNRDSTRLLPNEDPENWDIDDSLVLSEIPKVEMAQGPLVGNPSLKRREIDGVDSSSPPENRNS